MAALSLGSGELKNLHSSIMSLAGASWLGRGLVKGGNYAGKAIHKGAFTLREHISPREVPAEVSPKVSKGLNVAKDATGGAVKVSQFIGEALIPLGISCCTENRLFFTHWGKY